MSTTIRVEEIEAPIQCCSIIAVVSVKTEAKPYGNGGTYKNIELMDESKPIKLTLFGEKYITVAENVKVFRRSFCRCFFDKFSFE